MQRSLVTAFDETRRAMQRWKARRDCSCSYRGMRTQLRGTPPDRDRVSLQH
jgi:hypothetical protein